MVLSYGALKSLRSKLKNEIRSLNKKIFHLKIENNLQFKIIQQLKTLNACSLISPFKCQAGHYNCKISHSRFNYANVSSKLEAPMKVYTNCASTVRKNESDSLFIKKLSKNVDLIQSQYGFPSHLNNFIMVASTDTIFILSQNDELRYQEKHGTSRKKKLVRYRHVPLLYTVTNFKPRRVYYP